MPNPETVQAKVELPPGTILAETLWDTGSLTFAAVVYTAAITIIGVLIATLWWPWRVLYAVLAVVIFVLGLTVLKARVIRVSRRIVGRLGDSPR
jgi:hypothetical protein